MEFRRAAPEDFEKALPLIRSLWDYNTYEEDPTRAVYERIVQNPECFAFFLEDRGETLGFCHGDYFDTLWMCGLTCYVSGIITKKEYRCRGFGRAMMDHVKDLASARGCKAIILDSGMPRHEAHAFYESYGFEKSCYGFELKL